MKQTSGIRTALIIHGYAVQHADWDTVMWGDLEGGLLGRASMGMWVAWRRRPDLILWNTGAPGKDGLLEDEYTFRYTLDHIDELPKAFVQFRGVDTASLADHVRRVSVLDRECMRTSELLVTAAKHFVADSGCGDAVPVPVSGRHGLG